MKCIYYPFLARNTEKIATCVHKIIGFNTPTPIAIRFGSHRKLFNIFSMVDLFVMLLGILLVSATTHPRGL